MGTLVSKARALVEMVRAFDAKDEQKARKIGTVISKSIQKDSRNKKYSEVIELDRKSKQLFPQQIRKDSKYTYTKEEGKKNSVEVKMDEGNYVIEINHKVTIVQDKSKEKNAPGTA